MRYRYQVRFIHVSGTRMIGQGTDRLSRGRLYEGVTNVKYILSLLPLGQLALKRSEPLRRWIDKWHSELGSFVETMYPEGWFVRGHDHDGGEENIYLVWIPKFRPGNFICIPSLGVDRIFIEDPHQYWHKRNDSAHVLVMTRLI